MNPEPSPDRPPTSQAGYALIEVTFALSVFTIVMLGVAATTSLALRNEVIVREHQAASDAASAKLDEIATTPTNLLEAMWADTGFFVSTNDINLPPAEQLFEKFADDPFTLENEAMMAGHVQILVDPDNDGSTDLIEIRVLVAYRSIECVDRLVELVHRKVKS